MCKHFNEEDETCPAYPNGREGEKLKAFTEIGTECGNGVSFGPASDAIIEK